MSIGIDKQELQTPVLLIDLDTLEKNIYKMADHYRGKKDTLRPHQKGHRLPIIARKQIEAGAEGVSMTSLSLAELYVDSGITDILITSEICGENKIRRVCNLSKHGEITISVDDIENVRQVSETATFHNAKVDVGVELYMGRGSCGVQIEKAKSFVKEIQNYRGVNFKGIWFHEVNLAGVKEREERKKRHFETLDKVTVLKNEIEDAGISIEMLGGGHTPTWDITPEYPRLGGIEVQAGSYVFSDWCSHEIEGLEVFDYALTVLTRCISRPKPDEAMFDFGTNSCSDECSEDYRTVVGPKFKDLEGVDQIFEREEISLATLRNPSRDVRVGDVFELVPPHSDTTAKMYDWYYGVRDNKVEVIWPNHGRGLL
jgi:D-serine deaminase-like pyridoxal phosphate-dependent protein